MIKGVVGIFLFFFLGSSLAQGSSPFSLYKEHQRAYRFFFRQFYTGLDCVLSSKKEERMVCRVKNKQLLKTSNCSSIRLHPLRAYCFFEVKNFTQENSLLRSYGKGGKEGDKKEFVHVLLAYSYLQIEKTKEAKEHFYQVTSKKKKFLSAYLGLENILEKQNNFNELIELKKSKIKIFGEREVFLVDLCRFYFKNSYFYESIQACKRAIKKSKSYWPYLTIAESYQQLKNEKESKRWFDYTSKRFSSSVEAMCSLAEFAYKREDYLSIQKTLKTNIEKTRDTFCLSRYAEALFSVGKYKEALPYFMRSCAIKRESETIKRFKYRSSQLSKYPKKLSLYLEYRNQIDKCK